MEMALSSQAAWSAAPAISAVAEAIVGVLRWGDSDAAVSLRAALGTQQTRVLGRHLTTLYYELKSPIARRQLMSEKRVVTQLSQLCRDIESILEESYIDEFSCRQQASQAFVGQTAYMYPLLNRIAAVLQAGHPTFAVELAIQSPRSKSLLYLISALEKYNDSVDEVVEDDVDQAIEDSQAGEQPPALNLRHDTLRIKSMANNLHKTLHTHWPCPVPEHQDAADVDNDFALGRCIQAYVELDSRWILPSGSMDDFFVILKGDGIDQLCELHYVAGGTYAQPPECICKTSYALTQDLCLFLQFDEGSRLWDDSQKALPLDQRLWLAREDSLSFGLISLKELLSHTKFNFGLAKKVEIIVARAALVLIDGPWMCDEHDLTLDTIFLSCGRQDDDSHLLDPTLTQVFIPTRFGTATHTTRKAYGQFAHAFPVIRGLGILIADMENELLKLSAHSEVATPLKRAYAVLGLISKRYGPGTGICKVINFCLGHDSTKLYPGGREAASLYDPTFLKFLYENIVRELEKDYNRGALVPWEQIYRTGKPKPVADLSGMVDKRTMRTHKTRKNAPTLAPVKEEQFVEIHHSVSYFKPSGQTYIQYGMKSRYNPIAAVESPLSSVDWFSELEQVHMLLNSVQGRKLNFRGKPDVDEEEVNGLIKVALLDTGVDLTHPELEDYLNNGQLHMGLDLVDQENHDGPVIDLDGHGTHMCHTLLRTAPYAMVYPVRVFKDRHTLDQDEESRSASLVAKAIHHAVEEWGVDIITMSFAFRTDEYDIEDAIEAVQKHKRVLVFAAASNNTALNNEPVGYPARCSDSVICINSSSAAAVKSLFSPDGIDGERNLSAVGEEIEAAWPLHLTNHNSNKLYRVLSGTSSATVVAAGVAALILDFARQTDVGFDGEELTTWNRLKPKLWKIQDMRTVIWTCMTHRRRGCHYNFIKPWLLLKRTDMMEIAREIIRALKGKFRSRG